MSTRQMGKRLEKLEAQFRPKHDDGKYTLEELCRVYWQLDQTEFRKMAQRDSSYSYFIPQFEREATWQSGVCVDRRQPHLTD